ncbi:MAG: hypothetical protein MI673_09860 [Thiotrichales bacterium]|nr:hypothetical protein [Thiotrichales bacterium]
MYKVVLLALSCLLPPGGNAADIASMIRQDTKTKTNAAPDVNDRPEIYVLNKKKRKEKPASNQSDRSVRETSSSHRGDASNVRIYVYSPAGRKYRSDKQFSFANGSSPFERFFDTYEKKYEISTGMRNARLDFTIAGLNNMPNVLSELIWEDMRIGELNLRGDVLYRNRFYLTTYLTGGYIFDGDNQDSDYFGNNRTMEFSRSNNGVDGDFLFEVGAGIGYQFDFRIPLVNRQATITPMAGGFYHYMDINWVDGFQTLATPGITPSIGPFAGLDSHYETTSYGPWLGIDVDADWYNGFTAFASFKYYWADYEGVGEWNLRTDFAQPRSFEHLADGRGYRLEAGISKQYRNNLDFFLSLDMEDWTTDAGLNRTFFSSNVTTESRFNEANWEYWGFNAGIKYSF